MFRRVLAVFALAALAGSASADLNACGDKFLRAGRSARTKGYAAVHPASILIYTPNATARGLQEFESLLKRAGHKPVALKDAALLSEALTSAKYDVVIADYSHATAIKHQFRAGSTEPGVLPILNKPSKAQEAEVAKHYHCVLKPETMTKYDALDQIDHVMALRRKGNTAAASAK